MATLKKSKPSTTNFSNIGDSIKIGGIKTTTATATKIDMPPIIRINTIPATIKVSSVVKNTDIGALTNITRLSIDPARIKFIFPVFQRESLPILPNTGTVFNDTLDPNKKWFLPDYALKPITEGGMSFLCEKTGGTDDDGNEAYKGELRLVFRQKTAMPTLPNARVERIPLLLTNAVLILKRGDTELPIEGSLSFTAPDNSEITAIIPLNSQIIKVAYGSFANDRHFKIAINGQYKAATLSGITTPISLNNYASQARWLGGQLVDSDNTTNSAWLPFNGSAGDSRGFVILSNVVMEDNRGYFALRMHPMWVGRGTIKGWLPWVRLPLKAVFKAKVGFVAGATGTDGVNFQVWEHHLENGREVWNKVRDVHKKYTGALTDIAIDLSHLSGQNVGIELRVDAGASSGQDWAAWVNPTIEGDPYRSIFQNQTIAALERSATKADISFNCAINIDRYQLRNATNNTVRPFGCLPPWNLTGAAPPPQYQRYNLLSNSVLAACGVKAVYLSNFTEREFLVIPDRYAITLNPDREADATMSVSINLDRPSDSTILMDFKIAPLMTDFLFFQLKKELVKSWTVANDDIDRLIKIVFPSQLKTETFALTLAPNCRIEEGDAFVAGYGHQFRVQLGGVKITDAAVLLDAIQGTNAFGQPFSIQLNVDAGEPNSVETVVNLWLKELAGTHILCAKNNVDNKIMLIGNTNFPIKVESILAVQAGKTDNVLIPFTTAVEVQKGDTLTINQTATQTTLAARWQTPLSSGLSIREKSFTTDNIAENLSFSTTSATFGRGITRIEAKFRPLNGNEVRTVLTEQTPTTVVSLLFPLSSYIGDRTVDYDLVFLGTDGIRKQESGKLQLRQSTTFTVSFANVERAMPL